MLTLILGGARSGKSRYAEAQARAAGGRVLYLATAEAIDDEMRVRIINHRAARPAEWRTCEAPRQVATALAQAWSDGRPDQVLFDCVTVWVNNVVFALGDDPAADVAQRAMDAELDALLTFIAAHPAQWLLVSNEVGLGIVPDTPLARMYRDLLGRVNQRLAATADSVLFMVAGLPMAVKGRA